MFLQQAVNGIAIGGIYALTAVGFSLIYSILRFVNLAHGSMIMVGAYLGYWAVTEWKLSLVPAILVAAAGTALVSLLIEMLAFRPMRVRQVPIIYYLVSSMAVAILFENLVLVLVGPTFRNYPRLIDSAPVEFSGLAISRLDLWAGTSAAIGLILLNLLLYHTRTGQALRAASVNLRVTGLMGVDTDRVISIAFLAAGALAGVAGVFLGIRYSVYPQLGALILKGFVAAVFGGLGSVSGAVVGGLALGVVEVLLIAYTSSAYAPVFIYALLILILLLRPRGLMGQIIPDKA